jgi:hypothetical protein
MTSDSRESHKNSSSRTAFKEKQIKALHGIIPKLATKTQGEETQRKTRNMGT